MKNSKEISTSTSSNSQIFEKEDFEETFKTAKKLIEQYNKEDLIEAVYISSKAKNFVFKVEHENKNYIIMGNDDYENLKKLTKENNEDLIESPYNGYLSSIIGIPIIKNDDFVEYLLKKHLIQIKQLKPL